MTPMSVDKLINSIPEPATQRRRVRNDEAGAIFLAALRKGYLIKDASRVAGLSTMQVASWRRSDATFAALCLDAIAAGNLAITRQARMKVTR